MKWFILGGLALFIFYRWKVFGAGSNLTARHDTFLGFELI